MMTHVDSMMERTVAAAHTVEASFCCPFFGQVAMSMETVGMILLGTILVMVSFFISLGLTLPILLALLVILIPQSLSQRTS